jgi:hypothetical protein
MKGNDKKCSGGEQFAMAVDRFGIQWMVSITLKSISVTKIGRRITNES